MSAWARCAPVFVLFLGLLSACSGTDSPTQPSSIQSPTDGPAAVPTPTPGFGALEGRVADAETGDSIAGARIDAASGVTSFSVTTNAVGAFRIDLPTGIARVRATKEGYVTYNSEHAISAGPMTLRIGLMKVVVPPPAPTPTYTLSGLVLDLHGTPIGDATTYAYCCDSPVDGAFGWTSTDAAGRFTITATRFPENVRVEKTGYQRTTASVGRFPSGSAANVTIVVPRYVRYTLVPVSLMVGNTVSMTARFELDVGASEARTAANLSSSNSAVIAAVDGRYVKGIAPGTATITGNDEGLTGSVVLTVTPSSPLLAITCGSAGLNGRGQKFFALLAPGFW